ncbi:MAG: 3-dehydroquinate synthase, partial [Oxalobacteraceae bacterium]|nr:3-dehydroquinate synthase [Oxalobacteraceae bacterium]
MSPTPASVVARLNVDLGERSYPIIIGNDLLTDIELIRSLPGKRIAIVTNTVVAPLYLEHLSAGLQAAGKQCVPIVLPDGEEEKNVENLM